MDKVLEVQKLLAFKGQITAVVLSILTITISLKQVVSISNFLRTKLKNAYQAETKLHMLTIPVI